MEAFVREVLERHFPGKADDLYKESLLIQYLDTKAGAIHGGTKARRSLANYYAIYSILNFYVEDYANKPNEYRKFEGYEYTKLLRFYRGLYGGNKLQNHALNSRVNGEFRNRFHTDRDLIIVNAGKYALHIDYLYVDGIDIGLAAKEIIQRYIALLSEKDSALGRVLRSIEMLNPLEKKAQIAMLLNEDAEARMFEIISYAILKNHFGAKSVFIGYSKDEIHEEYLQLYKTGRTNANDGGIDFVMRPVGRFFQVTEVGTYDKYLLDMDKVQHFPVSFVVKTCKSKAELYGELDSYIRYKSGGMTVIEERYRNAIEEIITINEIKMWLDALDDDAVNSIVNDIAFYYKVEMNINEHDSELGFDE